MKIMFAGENLNWKQILCVDKEMGWQHSTKSDTDSYDIEGMEDVKKDGEKYRLFLITLPRWL